MLLALCLGLARPAAAREKFASNLGLLDRLTQEAVEEAADSLALPRGSAVTVISRMPREGSAFVIQRLARALSDRGHTVRMILPDAEIPAVEPEPEEPPTGTQHVSDTHPGRAKAKAQQQARAAAQGDTTGFFADSLEALEQGIPLEEFREQKAEEAAREEAEAQKAAEQAEREAAESLQIVPSVSTLPAGEVIDVDVLEFGVSYAEASRKLLFGPVRFSRIAGAFFQLTRLQGPEGTVERVVSVERHEVDRLASWQKTLAEGATYPFAKPELLAPGLGRYVEPAVVVTIVGSLVYLFYQNQN